MSTKDSKTEQPCTIHSVKAMLHDDSKMEDFLQQRSQLYKAYGVKDKGGKFRSVIDMQSVTELLKELLCNLPLQCLSVIT